MPTWASWTTKNRSAADPGRCRTEPGRAALAPRDDDISHVLDYRRVRQIIIDECTAEHVNLLESLIGKLANRLMQLPGVLGVRVKIAKLEILTTAKWRFAWKRGSGKPNAVINNPIPHHRLDRRGRSTRKSPRPTRPA